MLRASNYEELISKSEYIVYGTIETASPFMTNDPLSILSNLEVKIKEVLKGDLKDKKITVISDGGEISYSEYFEKMKDKIKMKLTDEDFCKAEEEAKNNKSKKVESLVNGKKPIKVEENVLLFLKTDVQDGKIYITDSVINGEFTWNTKDNTFYRDNEEASNKMEISLKNLKGKISNTKDISQELKQNELYRVEENPKFKTVDTSIPEKDPQIEKYKH